MRICRGIAVPLEDAFWRESYSRRPYTNGASFDDYGPAYAYGVGTYSRFGDRSFDEVEPDLSRGWNSARGRSGPTWGRARHATRDAWDRLSDGVERAILGDSDRDGK